MYLPPEGMLLLPGEPLAILKGPKAQILLMESALRWLLWRSSQWATKAAFERWERKDWIEEDPPSPPPPEFNPDGWKIRAEFIGGASADHILETIREGSRLPGIEEGLQCKWTSDDSPEPPPGLLTQVRRVYKANHAYGDIWLNRDLEKRASVARRSANYSRSEIRHRKRKLQFTRFQPVYQPMLVKGHPVRPLPRVDYLRQRTLKQLDAFHFEKLEKYPRGWLVLIFNFSMCQFFNYFISVTSRNRPKGEVTIENWHIEN